jgi:hypothetical protein
MTTIPSAIVKTPKIILPIREDFRRPASPIPAMTLSIQSTSNVIDKRKTRSATPAPGSAITESDKPMAITPSTTCAICRPLGEMASAFKYWLFPHSNNPTSICYIDINFVYNSSSDKTRLNHQVAFVFVIFGLALSLPTYHELFSPQPFIECITN